MKVAVTGGIASGKTTLMKILKDEGYHVFSCDQIYHELLRTNEELRESLRKHYGDEIFAADGTVDRKILREKALVNAKTAKQLDGITHPFIIDEALSKMQWYDLSFCEVPLLFEGKHEDKFDKAVVIMRDDVERVQVVMKKMGLTREEAEKIISLQFNYDKTDYTKYYVIHNNSDIESLKEKLDYVLGSIKEEMRG